MRLHPYKVALGLHPYKVALGLHPMYDAGAIVYTQYTTHNGNDGGTLFQLAILEFCQFLH